jgi:hypothetical protein
MLLKAKQSNKVQEITGCIVYHNMQFIQLIEGDKDHIESLYSSIQADKRHYEVQTLLAKPSKQSLWTDWSMAFYNFSDQNDQTKYKRLLLETSFDNANEKEKNSEVLFTLRKYTSILLDH